MRVIIKVIFFSFIAVGCKKNTCYYDAVPPILFFQIKQNSQFFPDSILQKIQIKYNIDGVQKAITDLSPAVDAYANQGILNSRLIGTFESQSFIISYPNGLNDDTLFVKNILPTPATNCQYEIDQIKFNNLVVKGDTSFAYQPVYVFNKKQ